MKCSKCYKEIPDDSLFCSSCGFKIQDGPTFRPQIPTLGLIITLIGIVLILATPALNWYCAHADGHNLISLKFRYLVNNTYFSYVKSAIPLILMIALSSVTLFLTIIAVCFRKFVHKTIIVFGILTLLSILASISHFKGINERSRISNLAIGSSSRRQYLDISYRLQSGPKLATLGSVIWITGGFIGRNQKRKMNDSDPET